MLLHAPHHISLYIERQSSYLEDSEELDIEVQSCTRWNDTASTTVACWVHAHNKHGMREDESILLCMQYHTFDSEVSLHKIQNRFSDGGSHSYHTPNEVGG